MTQWEYDEIIKSYQEFKSDVLPPQPSHGMNMEKGLIYMYTITKHDIQRYHGVFTKRQQLFKKSEILIRLKNMGFNHNYTMRSTYEDIAEEYNQHLPKFVREFLIDNSEELTEFEKLSNDEQ